MFREIKMQIEYKAATNEDCNILFEWVNDEAVRKNAFKSEAIVYDAHTKWFEDKLNDSNAKIYLAYIDKEPIGQIRVDIEGKAGLIDYSIDNQWRGMGCGTRMLKDIIQIIKSDKGYDVTRLVGRVKYSNIAAQRAFVKAGYTETNHELYKEYLKNLD